MKRKILLFAFLAFYLNVFSQDFKKEKRIYLLDITKSMFGMGDNPDIFDQVKTSLFKGIEDISSPETIVTIIPFQATHTYETLPTWTFKAGDKNSFEKAKEVINSYSIETVPSGYTDIYSALQKAKSNIDLNRINYIFLLTDGEQSKVPSGFSRTSKIEFSDNDLKKSLDSWCNFSKHQDSYLFYVMLSSAAVNQSIVKIIEKQCNAYASEGTDMNIAFIKPYSQNIKINLHDDPRDIDIKLVANNWKYIKQGSIINLKLSENSLFELVSNTAEIKQHKISVKLTIKNNISYEQLRKRSPLKSKLQLSLSTKEDMKILNSDITIDVKNKKERVLTLEFIDNE